MPVFFKCPECSRIYRVAEDKAGLAAACKCGASFLIPRIAASAVAAPEREPVAAGEAVAAADHVTEIDDVQDGVELLAAEEEAEVAVGNSSEPAMSSQRKYGNTDDGRDATKDYVQEQKSSSSSTDFLHADYTDEPKTHHSVAGRIMLLLGTGGLLLSLLRPIWAEQRGRGVVDGLSTLVYSFDSYPAIFLYPISLLFSLMFLAFSFIGLKVGQKGGIVFSVLTFLLSLSGIMAVVQASTRSSSYFSFSSFNLAGFTSVGMISYIVGAVLVLAGGIICSFGIFKSYRDMAYSDAAASAKSHEKSNANTGDTTVRRGGSTRIKDRTPAAVSGRMKRSSARSERTPARGNTRDKTSERKEVGEDTRELNVESVAVVNQEVKESTHAKTGIKSRTRTRKKLEFKPAKKAGKKLGKKLAKKTGKKTGKKVTKKKVRRRLH